MEPETAEELDALSQIIASTQIELEEPDIESLKDEIPSKPHHICISSGIYHDFGNIVILMFLYLIQGIPLGLCASIPMLLQSRNVNYNDQALFSLAFWPFGLKLLWAPIVDSLYIKSFGRRKTWLIPTQYLIGIFMIHVAAQTDRLLGKEHDNDFVVNVSTLALLFFLLTFLSATQDIVVDGWALSMLSRRNVGWASVCNIVGQTAGFFIANAVFLALESADFCNKHLRSAPSEEGIVTLSSFLYFWGVLIILTTTVLCVCKGENKDLDVSHEQGLLDTYKQLLQIIKLPAVKTYTILIFIGHIGFAAADFVTNLKLIENGVKKEMLALFAVPMIPVQILIPLYLSKFTTSSKPMVVAVKAAPYRLLVGVIYAFNVWLSAHAQTAPGVYPAYFYWVLLASYAIHQVAIYCQRVSFMAFHAKVSDPAIGGTYMTLLNTIGNISLKLPGTIALWSVDSLTSKECKGSTGSCYSKADAQMCKNSGGSCVTVIDGYYVEIIICLIIGYLWYIFARQKLMSLDSLGPSAWKCVK